eukprot:c31127_g1_i1.p1 GENE.c31127_g1_i1~~c31127_g1_i1.p1  ORF type:complete len:296 (+),score=117.88 c31127_g1_i1:121-888(+)
MKTSAPAKSAATIASEACSWRYPPEKMAKQGVLQYLEFPQNQQLKKVTWHRRGEYFATVCPLGQTGAVVVHNLMKKASQRPFTKNLGRVECVVFHPSKPYMFLASSRHVHLFNLMAQKRIKKIKTGIKMISSLAVHPGGDNIIVGGYDRRVAWFDLDMSSRPYKTLRFHRLAVRQVCFHPKFPLFSSCSDDAAAHVFHGKVYNDLSKDATIVPLKVLRSHVARHSLGVIDCVFHPTQPWLFSAGADHTVRLFISQ